MQIDGPSRVNVEDFPTHWKISTIGAIAQVTSGDTPNRSVKAYWNGDIPWVTTSKIDFGIIQEADEYITAKALDSSSAKIFQKGTILMAMYGQGTTRGKVAILGIEAATNQACAALLVDRNLALNEFVFYYLTFFYWHIRELSQGGNQKNLNANIIRNIPFPLPPLAEQQCIINVISTWDHAIDLTTQLIEAKQQRKRGLMQQLLTGKKRFAQFNEPWKMVRIGDLLSESRIEGSNGRTAHKITVRLYGKGVQPKEEKSLGSEATKYYRRYAGQFIYSKLDFLNGAFGIIPTEMDGYESTLDLPCFDFQGSVLPKFFLYFVSREHFYSKFASAAIGGRKARRIQIEEFLSTEIELPNLDEQKCIAQVLDTCDQELALLNRKLALLKKQKQGLMQQLLTGKVRVKL